MIKFYHLLELNLYWICFVGIPTLVMNMQVETWEFLLLFCAFYYSHDKVKEKTAQKKKASSTRIGKERDSYCNSYLHACESLLSIIASRKQESKSTILSLKKSGPQLPQLLTQFSASIAGTGIAVILSIFCRVICSRVPFCASKLLSTSLGLGLVWLSWAVNRLRDTVISINKTPCKSGDKEEEMINHLDRNLKDIYFRAVALMAVVVLKAA